MTQSMFQQGDKVVHRSLGEGTFIQYEVFDGESTVEFIDGDGYEDVLRVSTHLLRKAEQ